MNGRVTRRIAAAVITTAAAAIGAAAASAGASPVVERRTPELDTGAGRRHQMGIDAAGDIDDMHRG